MLLGCLLPHRTHKPVPVSKASDDALAQSTCILSVSAPTPSDLRAQRRTKSHEPTTANVLEQSDRRTRYQHRMQASGPPPSSQNGLREVPGLKVRRSKCLVLCVERPHEEQEKDSDRQRARSASPTDSLTNTFISDMPCYPFCISLRIWPLGSSRAFCLLNLRNRARS